MGLYLAVVGIVVVLELSSIPRWNLHDESGGADAILRSIRAITCVSCQPYFMTRKVPNLWYIYTRKDIEILRRHTSEVQNTSTRRGSASQSVKSRCMRHRLAKSIADHYSQASFKESIIDRINRFDLAWSDLI